MPEKARDDLIVFAVPKGRILKELRPLLSAVGLEPEPAFDDPNGRLLRFRTNVEGIEIVRVRSFDVPTFVAFGAADLGVAGTDVLMEFDYPDLYAPLEQRNVQVVMTDQATSELIKYASNTFLAAKVTFINEISALCEKSGGNILDVAEGMGLDKRIGREFLRPGPGIGGSCFPKDARALNHVSRVLGVPSHIINGLIEGNDAQKTRMTEKIRAALGGKVDGRRIAVLGLTFKPDTDDMRESPALVILPALARAGADIIAHDPRGMDEAKKELGGSIRYADDPCTAVQGAEAVVLMTEWQDYRELDFVRMGERMKRKIFIDLRNVYDLDAMQQTGFEYHSVGRPVVYPD